ncbi:hypothetical protein [Sphingobium ummariense]
MPLHRNCRRLVLPLIASAALALGIAPAGAADPAPFELPGPGLRITVKRGDAVLPIAQVPSLTAGDELSIKAELPEEQGAHFILLSAFLRGATNPPPKDWIKAAETWKPKEKDNSLRLTVPKGARQMTLFLVPDTGGAEGTIADAVRGKPGEFIRATQELNQASLDRSRLDAFMAAIRAQDNYHPEYLRSVAPALARSLSMKLNEECLSKVIELQASCLLENRDALVLADVHSSSVAETLTGAPTDLVLQLSSTREAGYGYYSPYIGVVRDLARIFGAFSNPQFNYLPTLSVRRDDSVSLLLNSAPSFQKPKSVMVVAMPAIEADSPPRLRNAAEGPVCAVRAGTVLPVEGAPLVYSTAYARDMKLLITAPDGKTLDLPVEPRANLGGYVLTGDPASAGFAGAVQGRLHGYWGFEPLEGPDFALQFPGESPWTIAGEAPTLVIGRDNPLLLKGDAPACVESVTIRQNGAAAQSIGWKVAGKDGLALSLPLADRRPGELMVDIKYQGVAKPQTLSLRAYAQASRLDSLILHGGDDWATLSGQRLDQVASVEAGGVEWKPAGLTRDGKIDRLRLAAQGALVPPRGETPARVRMADGRTASVPLTLAPPRPRVTLLSRSIARDKVDGTVALDFAGADILPDDGRIDFSVRGEGGTRFSPDDSIEVAGASSDAVLVRLTAGKGLRIEGPEVEVASLDASALPPSTFGALRFRVVQAGEAGDWQPLVPLARLPRIEAIDCAGESGCTIRGRDLFLIASIAETADFARSTQVAQGYTGSTLAVGAPADGKLFLRLRDAQEGIVSVSVGRKPGS